MSPTASSLAPDIQPNIPGKRGRRRCRIGGVAPIRKRSDSLMSTVSWSVSWSVVAAQTELLPA